MALQQMNIKAEVRIQLSSIKSDGKKICKI